MVYKAFAASEGIRVFTIGLAFACYLVVYVLLPKIPQAWQLAAGATEEYFEEKEALWKEMAGKASS
ncbi:MAG: hypothetical protein ACOX2N_07860 [Peptococcia bacterium]